MLDIGCRFNQAPEKITWKLWKLRLKLIVDFQIFILLYIGYNIKMKKDQDIEATDKHLNISITKIFNWP